MEDSNFDRDHVRLLIHAIEGINRTLELRSLLTRSMDSAKTLMRSEASSLMLVDKVNGQLSVSIPTGPVGEEIRGISIPKGKGIGGWVAEKQQSYLSNEPEKSEQFWQELSPNFSTRNILCVPLLSRQYETLGVLQVLNKKDGEQYTEEDKQLFEVFASFVATAIEKVREVDELRKEVENRDIRLRKVHEELRENLISINSFLQIEANETGESKTRDILLSASARVLTIANAHFLLKNEEDMESIEVGAFINELFASVSAIFGGEKSIKIIADIEKIYLKVEKAFTLGLIVNEVLILIFRFAFAYHTKGEILIHGRKSEEFFLIEIEDKGNGLQLNLAESESNIDLTNVLLSLAETLEAELKIEDAESGGTVFSIRFIPEEL